MALTWSYLLMGMGIIICAAIGYCTPQTCDVVGCSVCNSSTAVCESSDGQIPPGLPSSLHNLNIHFTGSSVSFNSHLLAHVSTIETLTISGNVQSIAPYSFRRLRNLTNLTIIDTSLAELPANLFPSNNSIRSLSLQRNRLQVIPVHLFDKLLQLKQLNLAYNCIQLHDCQTIAPEFVKLSKLTDLNLAGIKGNGSCGKGGPSKYFLSPINPELMKLNLSEASFLWVDEAITLTHFTRLESIDLSGIWPYTLCPAKAATYLFDYLPMSLRVLHIRRWRTVNIARQKCYLTYQSLAPLKTLPSLEEIDFKYSDMVFGSVLDRSVFANFTNLRRLNIGYCRITTIYIYAFQDSPKLDVIKLNGNPLGSRRITFQRHNNRSITALSLKHVGIATDSFQFNVPFQFQFTDRLISIDLSYNFLHIMPIFTYRLNGNIQYVDFIPCLSTQNITPNISVSVSFSPQLRSVNLNHNFISSYIEGSALTSTNTDELCNNTPNLSILRMEANQLFDVTGLCPSITELYLRKNRLGFNWNKTVHSLSKLHKLKQLDLSENAIHTLSSGMFSNLLDLEVIVLRYNNISYIDANLFSKNRHLQTINLALNNLLKFDINVVPLPALESINLLQNQITNFTQHFLMDLEDSSIKILILGGNTFTCDCDVYFQNWLLRQHHRVQSYKLVRCSGENEFVYNYDRNSFECDAKTSVIVAGCILGSILLSALIAVPCYKYRWFISQPRVVFAAFVNQLRSIKLDQQCVYDGFISYDTESEDDVRFIKNELLPSIEDEDCCKMYMFDRDSVPGARLHTEMCNAMETSRKVVVVLSNSYMSSERCMAEADLAGRDTYGMKYYQPNRMLVIVREQLNEEKIIPPITSLLTENVINIHGVTEERTKARVWKRVKGFMARPRYAYRKKTRPPVDSTVSYTINSEIELPEP